MVHRKICNSHFLINLRTDIFYKILIMSFHIIEKTHHYTFDKKSYRRQSVSRKQKDSEFECKKILCHRSVIGVRQFSLVFIVEISIYPSFIKTPKYFFESGHVR